MIERDPLDVPLHDAELLEEVELSARVIIAASNADGPLTQAQVDVVLGL
jgi:hypothetical protein